VWIGPLIAGQTRTLDPYANIGAKKAKRKGDPALGATLAAAHPSVDCSKTFSPEPRGIPSIIVSLEGKDSPHRFAAVFLKEIACTGGV
jgi:hypothetical protein